MADHHHSSTRRVLRFGAIIVAPIALLGFSTGIAFAATSGDQTINVDLGGNVSIAAPAAVTGVDVIPGQSTPIDLGSTVFSHALLDGTSAVLPNFVVTVTFAPTSGVTATVDPGSVSTDATGTVGTTAAGSAGQTLNSTPATLATGAQDASGQWTEDSTINLTAPYGQPAGSFDAGTLTYTITDGL